MDYRHSGTRYKTCLAETYFKNVSMTTGLEACRAKWVAEANSGRMIHRYIKYLGKAPHKIRYKDICGY